jgi:hypothetical protein
MRRGIKTGALALAGALSVTGLGLARAQQGAPQAQPAVTQTNTAVFIVEGMT